MCPRGIDRENHLPHGDEVQRRGHRRLSLDAAASFLPRRHRRNRRRECGARLRARGRRQWRSVWVGSRHAVLKRPLYMHFSNVLSIVASDRMCSLTLYMHFSNVLSIVASTS